jgi:transketolase
MSLRAIPGLRVIRPADATETAGAWKLAIESDGPTALILSRQDLPVLANSSVQGVAQGAYILADVEDPDAVLVGTGSELALCLEAAAALGEFGIAVRVVSMPCWEAFEDQPLALQESILPAEVPTVSVEAGVTLGWGEHADIAVGIDRFGASAPGDLVLSELGMNVGNVTAAVRELLESLG